MSINVKWDKGIIIEKGETKLIFDPSKNDSYEKVFITHAHLDHSKGFTFRSCTKNSTKETEQIFTANGKKPEGWNNLPIKGTLNIDDIKIVAHNSGHVLGSSYYEIIMPEYNIIFLSINKKF